MINKQGGIQGKTSSSPLEVYNFTKMRELNAWNFSKHAFGNLVIVWKASYC